MPRRSAGLYRPDTRYQLYPPRKHRRPSVPDPTPVHESHGTVAYVTSTQTSIPVPSGVVAGALLVVQVGREYATAGPPGAIVPPSGAGTWVLKSEVTVPNGTDTVHQAVYYKYATGADSGSYVFTWTGSVSAHGSAHRISGGPTSGDPFSGFDHEVAGSAQTNAPTTQIADTVVDNVLLVWLCDGYVGNSAYTPPSGFTEVFEAVNLSAAWKTQPAQGDTGALTGSNGGSDRKPAFLGSVKPLPVGGGQTIAANQAVETETGQAVGRLKSAAAAQALETETGQLITARKTSPANQAAETETAQGVGRVKTVAVGQATETETAQAVAFLGPKIIAVGQATEVETAQPATARKTVTAAQVVESEQAQVVTARKTRAVGQAAEAETAQTATKLKARTAAQAAETETAQLLTRRKTRAANQALETETAQPVAQAGEIIVPVVQAVEIETAQAVTVRQSILRTANQAVESETAQAVTRVKRRTIGQPSEAETAQALGQRRTYVFAQAFEVETALPVAVTGGAPPPPWVEVEAGGGALVEAAAGGNGQVELVGAGIGMIEVTGGV
jgi:hypothetical protein